MNNDQKLMNEFIENNCVERDLIQQVSKTYLYDVLNELYKTNSQNTYLKQCIYEEIRRREKFDMCR